MAIDGNSTKDFTFREDDAKITVTLTVKDGLMLKILEKLANEVQRMN